MNEWNVADQLAIRNLYATYTYAVDDHDTDAFVDCFTPDAVIEAGSFEFVKRLMASGTAPFINPEGRVVGAANIRAMNLTIPDDVLCLHISSNVCITRLDGDTAEAKAAFAVIAEDGVVEHYGRYLDRLALCPDGRWRFAERRTMCRYERQRKAFGVR